MKTDIRKQDIDVTWQNLNPGTVVTGGATAPEFNTGEACQCAGSGYGQMQTMSDVRAGLSGFLHSCKKPET